MHEGLLLNWDSFRQNQARKAQRDRHRNRNNIAFCDGHAELLKHDNLYGLSPDILQRWNRDHEPHLELVPFWVQQAWPAQ